ncbi:hypothetical protein [Micromonospora sp. WMMD812]|uniref:hypothetical protein n=1 Tax=Micromonospora sp. WMMD812 TaxID=3015152 RepID=UPI00248AB2A0|nr:hypothetical protein [Micromonospora sp. WMMD812]WBB67546.1 hypothetical protein O7603_31430 [Micromonospora sp. WMMD812]
MAIEWTSRVNRAFLLRDALDLTGVRLAELVGRPDARGRVEAREASAARRRGGTSGPVPESVLRLRIDPERVEPPPPGAYLTVVADAFVEVLDWKAAALVSVGQVDPRSEDPETGLFASVAAARTPASQVLAIAATIALAECGGGEVIDEYGYLSDARLNAPVGLRERLRVPAPQESVDAGIDAVLARTRLT